MRALFLKDYQFKFKSSLIIEGNDFHHLIKVTRSREGDKVLLLNGNGEKTIAVIKNIQKKNLELIIESVELSKPYNQKSLALCLPKTSYLEEIIKVVAELGVTNLYPIISERSQRYELKKERLEIILKNSYQQSNNPFSLTIHTPRDLLKFSLGDYDRIWFFNSQFKEPTPLTDKLSTKSSELILIGPEGGFSEEEISYMRIQKNVYELGLDCIPIMRTVTAVSFAFAYLMH